MEDQQESVNIVLNRIKNTPKDILKKIYPNIICGDKTTLQQIIIGSHVNEKTGNINWTEIDAVISKCQSAYIKELESTINEYKQKDLELKKIFSRNKANWIT